MFYDVSGRLGKHLIFKIVHGKTIITSRPITPVAESGRQRANRRKFSKAAKWAQRELLDEGRKAYYNEMARKLRLPNAYTAAVTCYMRDKGNAIMV